jgi:hypothetical protein
MPDHVSARFAVLNREGGRDADEDAFAATGLPRCSRVGKGRSWNGRMYGTGIYTRAGVRARNEPMQAGHAFCL